MSIQIAGLSPGVLVTQNATGALVPLVGRPVNIYLRGTTTPGSVFQDAALTQPQPQPITSLADGSVPGYVAATAALDIFDAISGKRLALEPIGDEGLAGIVSVFGRVGAVVSQTGDYVVSQVTGAAALASPIFTGVPQAPTAPVGTNTAQIATTAFVQAQIAAAISTLPVIVTPPVIT